MNEAKIYDLYHTSPAEFNAKLEELGVAKGDILASVTVVIAQEVWLAAIWVADDRLDVYGGHINSPLEDVTRADLEVFEPDMNITEYLTEVLHDLYALRFEPDDICDGTGADWDWDN